MMKRKIVLRFISGADEFNNYRYKKKTIKNIRLDASDDQLRRFIDHYCSLTAYPLAEAVIVDERVLVMDTEEEEILLETSEEAPETVSHEESEDIFKNGVTRASLQEGETLLENTEPLFTTSETRSKQDHATQSASSTVTSISCSEKNNGLMKKALTSISNKPHPFSELPPDSFQNGKAPMSKAISASVNENQELLTPKFVVKKRSVAEDKKNLDLKIQSLLTPHTKYEKLPVTKNKKRTDIKKQSPPLETPFIEEEVIDASEASTIAYLLALALKGDSESLGETDQSLIKSKSPPHLELQAWCLTQEEEPPLSIEEIPLSKGFYKPPKKKRMHPPKGTKTKPAKKKR